jgi:hypothetical protein
LFYYLLTEITYFQNHFLNKHATEPDSNVKEHCKVIHEPAHIDQEYLGQSIGGGDSQAEYSDEASDVPEDDFGLDGPEDDFATGDADEYSSEDHFNPESYSFLRYRTKL